MRISEFDMLTHAKLFFTVCVFFSRVLSCTYDYHIRTVPDSNVYFLIMFRSPLRKYAFLCRENVRMAQKFEALVRSDSRYTLKNINKSKIMHGKFGLVI